MTAERPNRPARLGTLLAVPNRELQQRVAVGFAAAGLGEIRPAHHVIFQWLPPEGGRASDLAERIGTTKQAVGYLVAYLEEHGFLERVPDPRDRRAQIVRRTEKGWLVNKTARRLVEEVQADWAQKIGPAKMDTLCELLGELVTAVGFRYDARVGGLHE